MKPIKNPWEVAQGGDNNAYTQQYTGFLPQFASKEV